MTFVLNDLIKCWKPDCIMSFNIFYYIYSCSTPQFTRNRFLSAYMRIIPAWEAHSKPILIIKGIYIWRAVTNFAQNFGSGFMQFWNEQTLSFWYIVVFLTLLVWEPLKLDYFLPQCCSTIWPIKYLFSVWSINKHYSVYFVSTKLIRYMVYRLPLLCIWKINYPYSV